MNTPQLSDNERAMFIALGYSSLLDTNISVPGLYRLALEETFTESKSGPAAESLRRCCKALRNNQPFRFSQTFDKLIDLSNPPPAPDWGTWRAYRITHNTKMCTLLKHGTRDECAEAVHFDRADEPAPDRDEFYSWHIVRVYQGLKA